MPGIDPRYKLSNCINTARKEEASFKNRGSGKNKRKVYVTKTITTTECEVSKRSKEELQTLSNKQTENKNSTVRKLSYQDIVNLVRSVVSEMMNELQLKQSE